MDTHEHLLQILGTMLREINALQAQTLPTTYVNTTTGWHNGSTDDLSDSEDTSPIHRGLQILEQLTREALTIVEDQVTSEMEEMTLAKVLSRLVEIEKRQNTHSSHYGENAALPKSETIRILLVDGQAVSRAGLRHLLDSYAGLSIIGEAADGVQAVSETLEVGPQVVLMDTHLPEGQSLEALRQIKQLNLGTKVLLLATQDREEYLYETLRAGADGYVLKDITPDDLVQAIRRVAHGDMFIQPQIASRLIARYGQQGKNSAHSDVLTNREIDVLHLLARGLRNKEIATRLSVSERTINFHLTNIYQKLQVSGRTEALSKALEQRLITPP
jgi:DNA-binding NarL/FixJ family response regulator